MKWQFFLTVYPVHSDCLTTLISKILGTGDSCRLFLRLFLQNLVHHMACESWPPVRLLEHYIRFAKKRNVLVGSLERLLYHVINVVQKASLKVSVSHL